MPQKIVKKGDPYEKEVTSHVQELSKILEEKNIKFANIHLAYQSKLGPVKWLEPSLEEKLKSLTNKKVLISPLSFTVDNSETEFELHIEYQEIAHNLGFEEYLVASCPNADTKFIEAIKEIILDF